jgi:hypothetical protein
MQSEFNLYDKAPWFWFYVALSLGADICENPKLSVKNQPDRLREYGFDLFSIFDDAVARYNLRYGGRKRGII